MPLSVTFNEAVVGKQALNDKVTTLLAGAPGFVFTEVGPVRRSQDLGILGWAFGPEGETPVVTGIDVVTGRRAHACSPVASASSSPPPAG